MIACPVGDDGEHGVLTADSSPAAERIQVDLWRRMTGLDKVHTVTSLTRTAQELALAGVRMRYPRASEGECLLRLAVLKLGPCLAVRAYPNAARLIDS